MKVGSRRTVVHCAYKPFKKRVAELLMNEIVSSSGHKKFYSHRVFGFTSLISSLQALVLRTGFIQQCESTRKAVGVKENCLMFMMEQFGRIS